MAEEKKRKIDLKARLGKGAGASTATPPPGAAAAIPVPVPVPSSSPSRPPPPVSPSRPPPVGVLVGPPPPFASAPALDPSNPLAAVAGPFRPAPAVSRAPAAPPQPQRIEVDEAAVQQAASGARKQIGALAVVLMIFGVGIGYVAGTSSQQGSDRQKSVDDAKDLSKSATDAKAKLTTLAEKLEAGRNTLANDHKFPDTLAADLTAIHIDFDGTQLAGRRFSGFSTDTMSTMLELITSVSSLNDRKDLVVSLLTKLKAPLTDQLAHAGEQKVSFVVLGDKDPSGNAVAYIAPLIAPIPVQPPSIKLPEKFVFANPLAQGNADGVPFKSGDFTTNHQVLYVAPKTIESVCPNQTSDQAKQLASQIGNVIHDIRGDAQAQQDIVTDAKPGLLDQVNKLIDGLNKVGAK